MAGLAARYATGYDAIVHSAGDDAVHATRYDASDPALHNAVNTTGHHASAAR
jgi:hypothetical protein